MIPFFLVLVVYAQTNHCRPSEPVLDPPFLIAHFDLLVIEA